MTEKTETTEEATKDTTGESEKTVEKSFTQSEVNALMAKERKTYQTQLKAEQEAFATFKASIEEKQAKAEEAAKEKVSKLRDGLPEGIINLLDKLTPTDQLEWLSDPANTITNTKQTIHKLPDAREGEKRAPSIGVIV